ARWGDLGEGDPNPRHGGAGRDGFPPQPRDLPAIPGAGGGRVHRVDTAARARAAVPGGSRQGRSLAVQERPGDLVDAGAASYSIATIASVRRPPGASTSTSSSSPRASSARPSGESMLM